MEKDFVQKIENEILLSSFIEKYKLNQFLSTFHINQMNLYRISKGEMIYNFGEEIEEMYFIVEGKVKIFVTTPDDKSMILRFQKALVLIGEVEFVHNDPAFHSVEASTECWAIGLSYQLLRENLKDNTGFLQFLLEEIAYKFRTRTSALSINVLYPVEVRFASYLLSVLTKETGAFQEEMGQSSLSEIAEMVGTSYRHLNRIIQKMCVEGTIERENGSIHILNLERLKELAKGNIYE